jgi:hypothetical protein
MNANARNQPQQNVLDAIEGAIAQRQGRGNADESRFGFAATLVNATPPLDKTFRGALRAKLVAEAAKHDEVSKPEPTYHKRQLWANTWRLVVGGGLATAFILIFAFIVLRLPGAPSSSVTLDQASVKALVNQLNAEGEPRTLAVFPPDYAPLLDEKTSYPVVPLAVDEGQELSAVLAAMSAALPSRGLVDVILVDQEGRDQATLVKRALEQHLFRLYRSAGDVDAESFGALERTQYVSGLPDATLKPVGETFNNGIELVAAAVLDDPTPGHPLRVALDWRTAQVFDEPVSAFTHLTCEGRLIAQRDAIPGNGQFPVRVWEADEVIRDQFAILMPEDLPAGVCEVQVGLYNAETGMRYVPVESAGPPFIVIEELVLDPIHDGD